MLQIGIKLPTWAMILSYRLRGCAIANQCSKMTNTLYEPNLLAEFCDFKENLCYKMLDSISRSDSVVFISNTMTKYSDKMHDPIKTKKLNPGNLWVDPT